MRRPANEPARAVYAFLSRKKDGLEQEIAAAETEGEKLLALVDRRDSLRDMIEDVKMVT